MLHRFVEVRISRLHGKGLFAGRTIKRVEVVWRLDTDEPRLTRKALRALPESNQALAFQFKDTYIICHDGSQYMNHSCDPNTWWAADTELVARRDIYPREEITYDYATADVSATWIADWRCRCGSPYCRVYIPNTDCLDKSFQARYRGHLPSWTVAHIAQHT